jgi:hypothetical protein
MLYSGGIYNGKCSFSTFNHAVTMIGWGVSNGIEYYLVRNSWSTAWGENGNIRIRMNGNCHLFAIVQPVLG